MNTIDCHKQLTWSAFKAVLARDLLVSRYLELDDRYIVYAATAGPTTFFAVVWKSGKNPDGNDTDFQDFDTNYKTGAQGASTPSVVLDEQDGLRRIAVSGKVYSLPPAPPADTTPVTIPADTPLAINQDTHHDYVIPNGKTFYLQQIVVGAEGDPTEKGSKVEVSYFDGTSYHVIERLYFTGFTQYGSYPDIGMARDGTALVGNGSTKKIRVSRIRLSGSTEEVDCVVRGYLA